MGCGQSGCDSKRKGLCPLSFGLALAITVFLFMFITSVWLMYHGAPIGMGGLRGLTMTWGDIFVHSSFGALKGFVFGLLLALIYDGIMCCCKAMCCKSSCCNCGTKDQSDVINK